MSAKKTPLYNCHVALKAHMVEFAGSWLPLRYKSEKQEHEAVRNSVGIFDVSHMGEFFISGGQSCAYLQKLLSRDVDKLTTGQAQYCLMLNSAGGIIDDLIVYKLGPDRYMLCVNAANIKRDWQWLNDHAAAFVDVSLSNESDAYAQIAVQGPHAIAMLRTMTKEPLPERFTCCELKLGGIHCLIARTGYSGEDGVEIFLPSSDAEQLWKKLLVTGRSFSITPCGLAARDSLRLEAGLLLHGTDINEDTSPIAAQLNYAIDWEGPDFLGKSALLAQQKQGIERKLVGFRLLERGIARHGFRVLDERGSAIGEVSSGSWPPTQERGIGLAYIDKNFANVGRTITIDIRNKATKATIVKPKFLKNLGITADNKKIRNPK